MNILLCLVLLSFKNNVFSSISCTHELRKIRLTEREKKRQIWDSETRWQEKGKIPRCKTPSKMRLASKVSRSGQNFPSSTFFKVSCYTLQPQETFHSEYLLGLVYNHLGRPAKQPQKEGGTPICGLYRYVSPNRICSLPLRLWNRV